MPHLALYLLGTPCLERDGEFLTLHRRKVLALLAYLILTRQQQRRDQLAALFWPDYDQTSARANLRRTLSLLNQLLNDASLQTDRETVSLTRGDDFWLDVDQFHHYLKVCTTHGHPANEVCPDCLEPLSQAVSLYRDDFLTGFTLPDSPEFDEWQLFQTESLRRELTGALEKLVRGYGDAGDLESAIDFARRWLALDPLQESAHCYLMRLLTRSGQRNAALAQYDTCCRILVDELGVEPTAETKALYQQIRAGELVTEEAVPVQQRTVPLAPQRNLPTQLTPFVGREEELAEITTLLQDEPDCRLLTLVGPGGSGKTRLAIQVASNSVPFFVDGVYFISLVSIRAVDSVVSAIAAALNLQLTTDNPRQQLFNYLSKRNMLLVLDNFEQLIDEDATALVAEMLQFAPRLKLLVTSRERLKLQEEWGFEVRGMRFPAGDAFEIGTLESYSAIQLFLQRARRSRPDFALSNENAADILRICQLVEGMPLAIELAVTWLRMMSCREIVQETARSLDFLTTSLRDVPERHHSLRAVFEHSWLLLSEEEAAVLRRLSVFRSGFRLRAAEQIADASLLLLSGLVDKSLLRRTRSGRYQIHELLRQYAAEKLDDHPAERERAQDRHADYYLTFLRQRAEELKGPQGRTAFQEISTDFENVRAAWNRTIARSDFAVLGRSADGLVTFGEYGGSPLDGLPLIQRAKSRLEQKGRAADVDKYDAASDLVMARLLIAEGVFFHCLSQISLGHELLLASVNCLRRTKPVPESDLACALYQLSHTYWTQGKYEDAELHARESLTLYTKLNDRWGMGVALEVQGWVSTYRGDFHRANQLFLECLHHLEQRGEISYRADVRAFLGIIARMRGEYAQAQRHLAEAWQAIHDFGDRAHVAYTLRELGYLATAVGDYAQAEAAMREGAEIFEELDMRHALVFPLDGLGTVARLQGQYAEADRLHHQSLVFCRELDERRGVALCLNNLALLAYDRHDYAAAEEYARESLTCYAAIGHRYGVASALCNLGYVLCEAGRDRAAEASEKLQQAWEIARNIDAKPVALNVLVGFATLLSSERADPRELEKAAELAALALRHPAAEQETRDRAERLLDQLAARLSPASLAAAQERGAAGTLEAVDPLLVTD